MAATVNKQWQMHKVRQVSMGKEVVHPDVAHLLKGE